MAIHFLIASERKDDLRFGEFLAFANDLPSRQVPTPESLREALSNHPGSVVLWDAESPALAPAFAEALGNSTPASRVFVVTDLPLSEYAHLAASPAFAHHWLRRYSDPAPELFARIVGASLEKELPFGLKRYFGEEISPAQITIKRSGQKVAAVAAIQQFFTKQNINTRLAALVAQACDELIMNAIFNAPILPNGMPLRRGTDRNADFELIEQEYVRLDMASTDEYVGICVSDQFGSLRKSSLMNFLAKDYHEQNPAAQTSELNAGVGLHGLAQSGISLLFLCKPGVRTEAMVFFAKGASYKTFRSGPRFLGVF